MKLHVKLGTHSLQVVTAPKLRKRPWVGQCFEIRERPGDPLIRVVLKDIKIPEWDGKGIIEASMIQVHYLEKI